MEGKYKLHQNVELGEPVEYASEARAKSKFWNEGKWEHFIKPFLPPSEECREMTFIEIGCSTGLYLKMAKKHGFREVLGIEGDRTTYEYALKYRAFNGLDYKLLFKFVGRDFKPEELPVADFVLFSTAHYYFDINSWIQLVDELKRKACGCIVVSRKIKKSAEWKASPEPEAVRGYFKEWEEVGEVSGLSMRDDPSPRKMYSLHFKSSLQRTRVSDLYPPDYKESAIVSAMNEFARLVVSTPQEEFIPTKTRYYRYWKWRMRKRMSKEEVIQYVKDRAEFMYDIKDNGVKYPLLTGDCRKLRDGGHRWAMLQALGYETAITRFI